MRALTATLLAAQRSASRKPIVQVTSSNKLAGVVNLRYSRLYDGLEPDGPHGLALAGDGWINRLRIDAADNRKLFRQRVVLPGEDTGTSFSQWSYMNQYGIEACAVCALGAEVSQFWVKSDGEINTRVSQDNGETWGFTDIPGYAPAAAVSQIAAAYKPNGGIGLFLADRDCVYVIRRVGGSWEPREMWDKVTGLVSGIAVAYDGDFNLLASGKDLDGNSKMWSLVYGDLSSGWSDLREIAAAPAGAGYEFSNLFLDKADPLSGEGQGTGYYRCFYTEAYTGNAAYTRPFWSFTLPGSGFAEGRWREPSPFETQSPCGLAMAHAGNYLWLEMPAGVWRASLAEITVDLSSDVISVRQDLSPDSGKIVIELANGGGKYAASGSGSLEALETGCQIAFAPGYRTAAGEEVSSGQHYLMRDYEHLNSPGKNSLLLYASDGWEAADEWIARYQFRWNKPDAFGAPTTETTVKEILTQVLARVGIRLAVISQSMIITGCFPDFTIHPGDDGCSTIKRLLSFVPDLLFMEGDCAYLVNPRLNDPAVYDYGVGHPVMEGRYRQGLWKANRVRIEGNGFNDEGFAWAEIQKRGDVLLVVEDLNITGNPEAGYRANSLLRKTAITAQGGFIQVPVNCGQQLYDVVEITDKRAGLAGARRILGIELSYIPRRGEYEQRLILGGV